MKTQQEEQLSVILGANELGASKHVSYNALEFVLRVNTKDPVLRNSYEIQVWRRINPMWVHIQHYVDHGTCLNLYADRDAGTKPALVINKDSNKKIPVVDINGQERLCIDTGSKKAPAYIRVMRSVLWSEMVED